MKKTVLFSIAMLVLGMALFAQPPKNQNNKKFFASVAAGPAFPVSDFASKDITTNDQAGLAKTGFNINLQFGYQFFDNLSLASTVVYSKHKLDISSLSSMGVTTDHWQYYGVLIGPMFTLPVNDKAKVDFKVLGGITNVNSPAITYQDAILMDELWSTTFALQAGAGLRYYFNPSVYGVASVDYYGMKPKFTLPNSDGSTTTSARQNISAVAVSVGVGIGF